MTDEIQQSFDEWCMSVTEGDTEAIRHLIINKSIVLFYADGSDFTIDWSPDPTAFGKRLKNAREFAGLSLSQLASVIGESRDYLDLLEQDKDTVSLADEIVFDIANAVGMTPHCLKTGDPQTLIDDLALHNDADENSRLIIIKKWLTPRNRQ